MKLRLMGVLLVLVASAFGQRLEHRIVLPDSLTSAKRPSVLLYNPTDTTLWVGADQCVLVLKPAFGEWVAKVQTQHQVAGICLNPVRNKVYVACTCDTLTVVDGSTHSIVRRIPTDGSVAHLAYSRASDRVFYATGDTLLGVVDCASDSVIGSIGANGHIDDICVNSDGTKLYCATSAGLNMQVIDCLGDSLVKTFWTGTGPFHLLYNPLANKVYCSEYEDEDLAIIDAGRDSLLRFISFDYRPGVLGFNPRENKVYCALSTNALAVISGNGDSLLAHAYADGEAKAIACDSLNNVVYAAVSGADRVSLVNGSNNGSMGYLPTGSGPFAVCYAPSAARMYVANQCDATITVAGGSSPQVLATLVLGMQPLALDWAGNLNRVYCADRRRGYLVAIDGDRDSVRTIATLPVLALAVQAAPAENKVYCAGRVLPESTAICVVAQPQDSLIRTVTLDGYFDALAYDEPGHRLLCLLTSPHRLVAFDCRNDSLSWSAPAPVEPRDIVLATQENRVFVSGYDSVAAYDLETGSRHASIFVGRWPGRLNYVSRHNRVSVAHSLDDTIVFVSAINCSVVGRVAGAGHVRSAVYNRRHDRLYCGGDDSGLVAIDCATLDVTRIPSTSWASDLLLDTIADKLYALADNWIRVVDCSANRLVESLPVAYSVGGLTWNPANRRVYVSLIYGSRIRVFYDSTIAAIAETPGSEVRKTRLPTIVRGVLEMPGGSDFPVARGRGLETSPTFLLDVTGRKVMELQPGRNDVSRLGAGIYFVRLASCVGRDASSVNKVVLAR